MTQEELKEFLETEEGKEIFTGLFKEYAKENGYKAAEEVEGLVKKRDQLLKQEVELKKKLKEKDNIIPLGEDQKKILDFLDDRDILLIEDLENKFSENKNKENTIDPLQLKRLQREKDDLAKQLVDITNNYQQEKEKGIAFQRKAILTQAITSVKVKPEMFKAVYALFDSQLKNEESENGYNFVIEDSESGSSVGINDFISYWSKTEEAKGFLQEPVNVGSGGQVQGSGGLPTKTRSQLNELPPIERSNYMQQVRNGEAKLVD